MGERFPDAEEVDGSKPSAPTGTLYSGSAEVTFGPIFEEMRQGRFANQVCEGVDPIETSKRDRKSLM